MRHSSVRPCPPPPPLLKCNNLGKAFQQFSPWKTQQTKAVAFVALPSDFDSPSRRTKNHMRLWAKQAYREGERCCHSSQVSIIINSPSLHCFARDLHVCACRAYVWAHARGAASAWQVCPVCPVCIMTSSRPMNTRQGDNTIQSVTATVT